MTTWLRAFVKVSDVASETNIHVGILSFLFIVCSCGFGKKVVSHYIRAAEDIELLNFRLDSSSVEERTRTVRVSCSSF